MELSRETSKVLKLLISRSKINKQLNIQQEQIHLFKHDDNTFCRVINELNNGSFFSEFESYIDGSYHIVLSDRALIYYHNRKLKIIKSVIDFLWRK